MIVTVCLNPSVDVALTLKRLKLGEINRTNYVIRVAGGKGNNVARVCKIIGEEVTVIQPLGGADGEFINKELKVLGIVNEKIQISTPTRRCIAIIDQGGITEVRENGPIISNSEYKQILDRFKKTIGKADIITASGSLPAGISSKAYADLIKIANKFNKPFFLDAKGEPLAKGIEAKPTMVKINETELAEWTGIELNTEQQYLKALQQITKTGIRIAIVSLGAKGMLTNWDDNIYKVSVPKVNIASTVGCGDATMAGIAVGYKQQLPVTEILKMGAAAGTAAALQVATGIIELKDFNKLKQKIEITKMN